ncbi:anti-sigma factor [Corynebacterium sp. MNWGS58]|uniref:anti-sigma factor n=1 Tax=Corynebacterium sp. 102791.4 TaxID=3104612 RepID=UPI003514986A
MSNTEQFDDETFDSFLDSVPEHTPPRHVKDKVLAEISGGNLAASVTEIPARAESSPEETSTVVPLRARSGKSRKPMWVFGGAAAAALLVAITVITPVLNSDSAGDGDGAIVAEESAAEGAHETTDGHEQMHEIMSANDMVKGATTAEGARLEIVSSTEMDKAGAMVDGQPELADGMGAQVWSVDKNGVVRSAGVIGQDPHDGVWMPFDAATSKVMVTEEPADGSESPRGRMLAEVVLEA